jgi:hypothetical protein
MTSSSFNIHDWIVGASACFGFVILFVWYWWTYRLEMKYTGPYTLKSASSKQKWRWAINLVFFYMSPFLGVAIAMIATGTSYSESPWSDAAICSLPLIACFSLVLLWKRWKLDRTLKGYISFDKRMREPLAKEIMWHPLSTKLLRAFMSGKDMSEERQRFYREGYSSDGEE